VADGATWYHVQSRVYRLLEAKEPRVYGVMKQFLDKETTETRDRAEILHLYAENDAMRAKDFAPKYLSDADIEVRAAAAGIVIKTGDKEKARPILGESVAKSYRWLWAAESLLADDTPESRKELKRLFGNPALTDINQSPLLGSDQR